MNVIMQYAYEYTECLYMYWSFIANDSHWQYSTVYGQYSTVYDYAYHYIIAIYSANGYGLPLQQLLL